MRRPRPSQPLPLHVQVSHFRLATVKVCAVLCHHTTYYNRTTAAVSPRSPTPPQRSRIRSLPAIRGHGRGFGRCRSSAIVEVHVVQRRRRSAAVPVHEVRRRFGRCRMPIMTMGCFGCSCGSFWTLLWAVLVVQWAILDNVMGRFGQFF